MKSKLVTWFSVWVSAMFILSGCKTSTSYEARVLGLSVGMSKPEVIDVMGPPSSSKFVNKKEFLIWRGITPLPLSYVEFSDAKSVGWNTGIFDFAQMPWHRKFGPERISLESNSKIKIE